MLGTEESDSNDNNNNMKFIIQTLHERTNLFKLLEKAVLDNDFLKIQQLNTRLC